MPALARSSKIALYLFPLRTVMFRTDYPLSMSKNLLIASSRRIQVSSLLNCGPVSTLLTAYGPLSYPAEPDLSLDLVLPHLLSPDLTPPIPFFYSFLHLNSSSPLFLFSLVLPYPSYPSPNPFFLLSTPLNASEARTKTLDSFTRSASDIIRIDRTKRKGEDASLPRPPDYLLCSFGPVGLQRACYRGPLPILSFHLCLSSLSPDFVRPSS